MADTIATQDIRPAPILLHAYHQVNKAFQGHIAINTYTPDLKISSENKEYHKAARQTLKDIQMSYTNGNLNTDLITNIIAMHLPEELQQDDEEIHFGAVYAFTKDIPPAGLKTLEQIVDAINTQIPDVCTITQDQSVRIKATSSKAFSNVFNTMRDTQSAIEGGKTLSDKQVKYILQNNFDEDYKNLNMRAQKRQQRRTEDNSTKNRVVSHKIMMVDNVNGIDLQPLASHLLARGKKEDYPFSALEEYKCFAKAARNERGIPSIRLQLPIYLKPNAIEDRELETRMKNVLGKAARAFNTDIDQSIDRNFISTLITKEKNGTPFNEHAGPQIQVSDKNIEAITHDDLYLTIVDWFPIDIKKIMKNIGAEEDNPVHYAHISKLMNDFVDEGLIIENENEYTTPAAFEGKDVKLAVISRDEQGNIYAKPDQWDESVYGSKPELFLPEDILNGQNITIYDILTVDLQYHMGSIENVSIKGIERMHELATDDSAVYHMDIDDEEEQPTEPITVSKSEIEPEKAQHISPANNIYIAEDAGIPADGIIAGVVRESQETLFFKPSLAGIGSFAISTDKDYKSGDILSVKISPEARQFEEILHHHGSIHESAGLSKLSAVEQGIPLEFPDDILKDTPPLVVPPPSKNRVDYRDIPCITIDPPTAKDFDDAIYIEPNDNGWKVMVFIADVSHYMKPDTNLFNEAYQRGNSTYLPDLTIPMLPEEISNQICSLVPNEDRACLVTTMQINHDGEITKKKFERGLMRSVCRLEYDQVQDAINGNMDEQTSPIYESLIQPAFDVYKALSAAREKRGALNFNTPEQRIDMTGEDEKITLEVHNESHGIIEELMIASNIAAIETLIENNSQLLARVHGLPNERVLRQFSGQLAEFGITMPADNIPIEQQVEQILNQAEESPYEDDIRRLMVRCQDKAKYSAELKEHYALQLDAYTHETSPIRRMTDWYIHCLLNEACNLKEGSRLTPDLKKQLGEAAEQFSMTERRSDAAERKTRLRLAASWVNNRLGEEFDAAITHVTDKGVFIKIANEEIRSFIPSYELDHSASNDDNSDAYYKPGKSLKVRPSEADEITGIIKFDIA